jgi:DNA repair protein RecN (Recombination protein N)
MLTRLTIRNIVLIEALDLDLRGGLGVLTGETGAGKSILLDALGLVLGNRAESGLVRAGTDKASVAATFEFAELPASIAGILDEAEIEIEAGEPLILRRTLKADGGSKAFVNDQPVGVALLREIAPSLVELHGQHDDRGLVNPRGHRALLDRFAGGDAAGVASAWTAWRAAEDRLAAARLQVETAQADQDLLLAHLTELHAIEPQAGEEARLAETRSAMQKGERLAGDLEVLRQLWEGSDSPLASLRVAAAARPDRRRASPARRGAGGPRPRGDRGGRGGGQAVGRSQRVGARSARARERGNPPVRSARDCPQAPLRGRSIARQDARAPRPAGRDRGGRG